MYITSIYYLFHSGQVVVKVLFEIIKETPAFYFTKNGSRYSKYETGIPCLKSRTTYPYIELVMVDADEGTLRAGLSKWFTEKANQIMKNVTFTR